MIELKSMHWGRRIVVLGSVQNSRANWHECAFSGCWPLAPPQPRRRAAPIERPWRVRTMPSPGQRSPDKRPADRSPTAPSRQSLACWRVLCQIGTKTNGSLPRFSMPARSALAQVAHLPMACGDGAVLSAARLMFAPHNTVTTRAPTHAAFRALYRWAMTAGTKK